MVRVIFTKGNFKELWGNHKQCTQHVSLMEHCQSVDTQDSSSVGFFRLITTHLCTDYFTYTYHLITCQNAIAHNNIITLYGILCIVCKMFTIYCCIAIQMRLLLNQQQEEQGYVQQVLKLQER